MDKETEETLENTFFSEKTSKLLRRFAVYHRKIELRQMVKDDKDFLASIILENAASQLERIGE